MFSRNKKELVETEKPKKRKMSRWHYASSFYKDQEEQQRLEEDIDYRCFKNQSKF